METIDGILIEHVARKKQQEEKSNLDSKFLCHLPNFNQIFKKLVRQFPCDLPRKRQSEMVAFFIYVIAYSRFISAAADTGSPNSHPDCSRYREQAIVHLGCFFCPFYSPCLLHPTTPFMPPEIIFCI